MGRWPDGACRSSRNSGVVLSTDQPSHFVLFPSTFTSTVTNGIYNDWLMLLVGSEFFPVFLPLFSPFFAFFLEKTQRLTNYKMDEIVECAHPVPSCKCCKNGCAKKRD